MSKFFVTTPIYYVNDAPHIGHAYTTILADVLSRYHRTIGDEVFFLTGLDEHGQKVKQAAEKRGLSPQAHSDDLAPRFLNLWKTLNIQYDDFIRTTQERHKKIVQLVLEQVHKNGDIYTDEYEGWYSVAEERFITDAEYESGQFRDVKKLKEKNYFFKMSKYQQKLIDYIQAHPDFIRPEHRKNEMLGFLRQPLGDLCISRPKARMDWGIEIPFDRDYVTYVWFDALVNYISVPGYGSDDQKFKKWWPADVHLIGKDILTTHCVYWTTMLFSLGLELPKTIFAHGWWLIGETKMSKSLGNVVNPLDLIADYGVDAVRFYLMREMVLGLDANFTLDSFIKVYNSDLANDYGNLLNRVSGLIQKNHGGMIPEPGTLTHPEEEIKKVANTFPGIVKNLINEFKVQEAIALTLDFVRVLNKYMETQAPWKLAKTDMKAANRVLYTAAEGLRIATIMLAPVMPEKTAEVLDILGAKDLEPVWGELTSGMVLRSHPALFPRIEVPLEDRIIDKKDKIVVFDASSYIALRRKNIDLSRVLLKERDKNIKAYISFWVLAELLSGTDIVTLENVEKHCFEPNHEYRFLAEPVIQVFVELYKEEPFYIQQRKDEMMILFNKMLNNELSEEERIYIKQMLAKVGKSFSESNLITNKIPSDVVRREAYRQVINEAKKLKGDTAPVNEDEINLFAKGYPGAGVYYEYLVNNKFIYTGLNKDNLLHDQRDWHLIFYGGKNNVYLITEEKKLKNLGLKNVMGLDQYMSNILGIIDNCNK